MRSLAFVVTVLLSASAVTSSFDVETYNDRQRRNEEDSRSIHRYRGGLRTQAVEESSKENEKSSPQDNQGFQTRIVGGTSAGQDDYPQFSRINNQGGRWCGGVLIHPKFVITAAHCNTNDNGLSVSVNAYWANTVNNLMDRAHVNRNVVRKIPHPKWSRKTLEFDFMLLELDNPIDDIEPIKINKNSGNPAPGDIVTVIGLGGTRESGYSLPDRLQHVNVTAISDDVCNSSDSYNGRIKNESMFCAAAPGKDACFGDSGGPALDKDRVLLGLVSFGIGCARARFPGVYSKASAILGWIIDEVCPPNARYCLDRNTVSGSIGKPDVVQQEPQSTVEQPAANSCKNDVSNVIMKVPVYPGSTKYNFVVASCSMVSRSPNRYCNKEDRRTGRLVWEVCRRACPKQSGC